MLSSTDKSTFVIVDKQPAAGGHWIAYPFVTLHQPWAAYGVSSEPLGKVKNGLEILDPDDLATGAEVLKYYDGVMAKFVATGRVRFFPTATCYSESTTFLDAGVVVPSMRLAVHFGAHAELTFAALHAPGLAPFAYTPLKQLLGQMSAAGPRSEWESFVARLTGEAQRVDALWASAAHFVQLAARWPGSPLASLLRQRDMRWCLETAKAAHKLELWARLARACVDNLVRRLNRRCGEAHGACEILLPARFCFASGETLLRLERLARRCVLHPDLPDAPSAEPSARPAERARCAVCSAQARPAARAPMITALPLRSPFGKRVAPTHLANSASLTPREGAE